MLQKIDNLLAGWILPSRIYNFVRHIASEVYGQKLMSEKDISSTLGKNKIFKNCHKGERCFIVANGPSVSKQNILPLKNEHVFFINKGWRHKDFRKIKPEYYCIPRVEEANAESVRWLKYINSKIPDKTVKFLSYYEKAICKRHKLFKTNTYFVIHHGRWGNYSRKDLDLAQPIPTITNTPMMCIQMALYMGFKEIYLIGVDYDFLTHYGVSVHFYKEKKVIWHDIWDPYEVCVRTFLKIMDEYRDIKAYAEKRGVKIYNATKGGYLEVFKRVNLESLYAKK